jgi:hypothetical protein
MAEKQRPLRLDPNVNGTTQQIRTLADLPELVGFFSYSREDDDDSRGALSALRDAIQRELRGQLGRTRRQLRLWQDKEAIAPGHLWESEIKTAVEQAVFFIPIITPTVVRSQHCRMEFDAFLERERQLGRTDLIFPIIYIRVPELEDEARWRADPVLSVIGARQWADWRALRGRSIDRAEAHDAIEALCSKIAEALTAPTSGILRLAPPGSAIAAQPASLRKMRAPRPQPSRNRRKSRASLRRQNSRRSPRNARKLAPPRSSFSRSRSAVSPRSLLCWCWR